MKKAVLEIDAPESCMECEIKNESDQYSQGEYYETEYKCPRLKIDISYYYKTRHPDCPLKIREVIVSKTIDGVETWLAVPEDGCPWLTEDLLDEEIAGLKRRLEGAIKAKSIWKIIHKEDEHGS